MTNRTGSYPLMNLAADYGVDYGDVLLWADYLRRTRLGADLSRARLHDAFLAAGRVLGSMSNRRSAKFRKALFAHADARWGRVETVRL